MPANARKILIEWIGEVASHFELPVECVFLATHYLDKLLNRKKIPLGKMQLAASAALLLARSTSPSLSPFYPLSSSKLQNTFAPLLDDLSFMTDCSVSTEQVPLLVSSRDQR